MNRQKTHVGLNRDPDPLLIDLLLGIVGSSLASAIAKAAKVVVSSRRGRNSSEVLLQEDSIRMLERNLEDLERRTQQALEFVPPGKQREVGSGIALPPEGVREYRELRESLISQFRDLDEFMEGLEPVESLRLPVELRRLLRLVDRKLRDARKARLSDGAIVEVRGAITSMRRLLELLEAQQ